MTVFGTTLYAHTHTHAAFSGCVYLDIRQKILVPLECRSQLDY